MTRDTKYLAILGFAVAILLAHICYYFPYTPDDTFISMRYAQRLVQGHGLTWNDGEYVEGYSNPLWVLLSAGLNYLGMALLYAVQSLSIAFTLLTLTAFSHYRKTNSVPNAAFALSMLVYALSAPVAIWAVGGLEMPLVMFLFAWVLTGARTLNEASRTCTAVKTGIALGLICLTRPEGPVYTAVTAIAFILTAALPLKLRVRTAAIFCFTSFAFFCALLAFRHNYYGTWVPNTVLAKVAFSSVRFFSGVEYAVKAILSFIPILWFIHHMSSKTRHNRHQSFLLYVAILLSLAIVFAGGDWLLGYRAFVPVIPVIILLLMESTRRLDLASSAKVTAVILCFTLIQFIDKDNLNARLGRSWVPNVLTPIAEQLRKDYGDKNPLIAVFTAGAIPYYTQFPTLDVYGLNDTYLTQHRHEQKDFGHGIVGHDLFDVDYIKSRKPDLLVFDIPGIKSQCGLRPGECEKLYPDYEQEIIDIPGYGVKIWKRKTNAAAQP